VPGEIPEEVAKQLEEEMNDGRFELSPEEQEERKELMEEGFKDWSRKDLRALVNALERYGRKDKETIIKEVMAETNKEEADVEKYYKTFWERHEDLPNSNAIMDRIRKGEARIARNKEIKEALEKKVGLLNTHTHTLSLFLSLSLSFVLSFSLPPCVSLSLSHAHTPNRWPATRRTPSRP
jgi:hypothetical protein